MNLKLFSGMKNYLLYILVLIFLILLSSCEKDSTIKENLFYEYYPVEVGHWIMYDVDAVVYDDFTGSVDTFYYQVKEVFESSFTDDAGNETIRLERFVRDDPDDNWQIKSVWTARRLPSRVEKVEENIRYIKLVFPPKVNKTWDGNAYNTKPEQTYKITQTHEPHAVNGLQLDSVVTVVQADFETLISKEYKVEKFALNIGMVYKEYVDLKKEIDGTVISGVDLKYSVVDYNDFLTHKSALNTDY